MNIAIVSSGSSIHVKKIANYLVNHGNKVTLFTSKNHTKLIKDFDKKIKIVILPFSAPIGYFLNSLVLKHKLKSGNYDLVNSHYASGYGTLARLTKFHPLALAVFGSDVYEYPYESRSNKRNIIKNLDNADLITSTSHVMVKATRLFYKKDKPIYVTPFGVDTDLFKPKQRAKTNDVFHFGIVKKLEDKYGIEILIRAYKEFCEKTQVGNTKLLIFGRGSAEPKYKDLAKKLGLEKEVIFRGFIPNEKVVDAFAELDVACFPSQKDSESFGVAAVEAMACGVSVIASDASGFREVIKDGVTGIIVPKNDITSLVSAMEKMYKMPAAERVAFGEKGRERVLAKYKFDDNMRYYLSLLDEVAK